MKKVKNRNNPVMVFALTTDTMSIKKFPVDDNGKVINPRFNAKTFTKKAYKSYLKGKTYFTYKGESYVVPKLSKQQLEEFTVDDLVGKIKPYEELAEEDTEIDNTSDTQE